MSSNSTTIATTAGSSHPQSCSGSGPESFSKPLPTRTIRRPDWSATTVTVKPISTIKPPEYTPTHHIDSPPTSFKNPWPSSPPPHSLWSIARARFFNSDEKNFVPVPDDRSQLVQVTRPSWGRRGSLGTPPGVKDDRGGHAHGCEDAWTKLKATWIGHASFLIELPSRTLGQRGVVILLDPVFSERVSPVSFMGPKRFTPTPCALDELPEVDCVCISHNHYDHLDAATIKFIHQRGNGAVKFLCAMGVGANLEGMGVGRDEIIEMDWWDGVSVSVSNDKSNSNDISSSDGDNASSLGELKVICTPSQHNSGRSITDHGKTLWCSWTFEEVVAPHAQGVATESIQSQSGSHGTPSLSPPDNSNKTRLGKKLFFAGDTAYRAVPRNLPEEDLLKLPVCTAFREVGHLYGPFDLALLPIGCYSPRWWMSAVHCAPEDSICIHQDIHSRKSIGMHYGVFRGGVSQYYEDVTEPPRRWKEACEKAGLKWQDEIGLCAVGETVVV